MTTANRPWRDRQTLHRLLERRGLSAAAASRELDCSGQTVRSWADKLNVSLYDPISVISTSNLSCEACGAVHQLATTDVGVRYVDGRAALTVRFVCPTALSSINRSLEVPIESFEAVADGDDRTTVVDGADGTYFVVG